MQYTSKIIGLISYRGSLDQVVNNGVKQGNSNLEPVVTMLIDGFVLGSLKFNSSVTLCNYNVVNWSTLYHLEVGAFYLQCIVLL